jgi:hypothetical protein
MKTQAVIGTLLLGALIVGASAANSLAITYTTLDYPDSVNTYAFGISGDDIVGDH